MWRIWHLKHDWGGWAKLDIVFTSSDRPRSLCWHASLCMFCWQAMNLHNSYSEVSRLWWVVCGPESLFSIWQSVVVGHGGKLPPPPKKKSPFALSCPSIQMKIFSYYMMFMAFSAPPPPPPRILGPPLLKFHVPITSVKQMWLQQIIYLLIYSFCHVNNPLRDRHPVHSSPGKSFQWCQELTMIMYHSTTTLIAVYYTILYLGTVGLNWVDDSLPR